MPDEQNTIASERLALMDLMDNGSYKVPNRRIDENIMIATWNIQNLSNVKTSRALHYIADICERFDIVALQEVKSDLRGLQKLQQILPGDYRILVTDPTGNYERFAFLYDKRTVIPTGLACEIGFNVLAKDHVGYQLHRMPFCASFRAGRFDFVIINVHIFCGSTALEKREREKEITKLVAFINERVKQDDSKVFDKDFFVMGDFNIEEQGDQFFKALENAGFSMPPGIEGLTTNFHRSKTFDKIAWVKRDSFKYSGKCNVVPFYQVLFQDKEPRGGKSEISDHLPLWAEFHVNVLTQQLSQIINPPIG
jgi:endonuclease/exonuclease/phosphatase family metal-dependent hydrolase